MDTIFIIEAFIYGLSGAVHCLGMCGPLALWIPVDKSSNVKKLIGIVIYSFGRILSYTFIGAIISLLGVVFKLIGFQDILSIICGAILILMAFSFTKNSLKLKIPFVAKAYYWIRKGFDYVLDKIKNNYLKLFFIGIINGFLPCGFLYFAVITATALGIMWQSILYMIFFGLGTIPVFLVLILIKSFINIKYNKIMQIILPVFTIIIGIVLILRGLNLGIPMISPKLNKIENNSATINIQDHMHCH